MPISIAQNQKSETSDILIVMLKFKQNYRKILLLKKFVNLGGGFR